VADRGLRSPRTRRQRELEDHYWDFFINVAPKDAHNKLADHIRSAPEDRSTPSGPMPTPLNHVRAHTRDRAKICTDLVGIVDLQHDDDGDLVLSGSDIPEEARYAIVCLVPAPYDPETSPGVGGQVPVQNGLMVSFILSAYLRESGYFATMRAAAQKDVAKLAVRAGLGSFDATGRFRTPRHGTDVWVADIVYTDFPLAESNS